MGKETEADPHKTGGLRKAPHAAPPDFAGWSRKRLLWLEPASRESSSTMRKTAFVPFLQAVTYSNTPPATIQHHLYFCFWPQRKTGESANAVPHYHKLCSRVSHIWGNRRGQHIRSAMDKPRPGKTTFVIMVSPLPGKYEVLALPAASASRSKHFALTVTLHRKLYTLTYEITASPNYKARQAHCEYRNICKIIQTLHSTF